MTLETRRCKTYETTNPSGDVDGTWMKVLTTGEGQINLVIVPPQTFAGFYIHGERSEWHTCIKGKVLIASPQGIEPTSENNPIAVLVPSLVPHGIFNASEEEAWIIVISDLPHTVQEDEFPMVVYEEEVNQLYKVWNYEYAE